MELEDPIEIILEMARKGEIDPWNIDVVDITDRFLQKLEKAKELDLRVSGRVLLYAAILVRMKAEAIALESLRIDDVEESDFEDDFVDFTDTLTEDVYPDFYPEEIDLRMRMPRRRAKRINTLKELIEELKRAEAVEKRRRKRKRRKEPQIESTLEVPHEESMEETIEAIEREIMRKLSRKETLTFSSIIRGRKLEEIVDYYISILHLVFRGRIEIRQEEFYGEIEIRGT